MSPRAGLNHDAVVDAAQQLVATGGAEALTLGALATHLGVRKPSLYNHVDGLPGVLTALRVRAATAQADRVGQLTAGLEGRPALTALCHALRAYASDNPGMYTILQPTYHAPDAPPELTAAGERLLAVFLRVLATFGIEGEDAIHATRAVRSAVHGFVTLQAAGAFGMAADLDESFARLVDTFATAFEASKTHA